MRFILLISILLIAMSAGASACICTADYKPVCGTNGKTYSNRCRMGCDGAKLKHNGMCRGGG